jgi:hypothetical protein
MTGGSDSGGGRHIQDAPHMVMRLPDEVETREDEDQMEGREIGIISLAHRHHG